MTVKRVMERPQGTDQTDTIYLWITMVSVIIMTVPALATVVAAVVETVAVTEATAVAIKNDSIFGDKKYLDFSALEK